MIMMPPFAGVERGKSTARATRNAPEFHEAGLAAAVAQRVTRLRRNADSAATTEEARDGTGRALRPGHESDRDHDLRAARLRRWKARAGTERGDLRPLRGAGGRLRALPRPGRPARRRGRADR